MRHRRDVSPCDSRVAGVDPFGVVLWPGALYAARRLCARKHLVEDATVPLALCAQPDEHAAVETLRKACAERKKACAALEKAEKAGDTRREP